MADNPGNAGGPPEKTVESMRNIRKYTEMEENQSINSKLRKSDSYDRWIWGLMATCMSLVLAAIFVRYFQYRLILPWLYMTASTLFLVVAMLAGAAKTGYGGWILTGLIFCWLGDLGMKIGFLYGVFSFLVAHLFFMMAFHVRGISLRRFGMAIPMRVIITAMVVRGILSGVSDRELIPILVYAVIITLMSAMAVSVDYGKGYWVIYLAAHLFYLSDAVLAFSRYDPSLKIWIYLCHPLYYPACLLFAFSVRRFATDRQEKTCPS